MSLRPGVVALIDCLGFKGIWNRHDPGYVLRKMLQLEERVLRHEKLGRAIITKPLSGSGLVIKTTTRFLSDTVCIASWYDGLQEWTDKESWRDGLFPLLIIVGQIAETLLKGAALTDPPISMRGAIAAGWFAISANFLIGPAVDEAAEFMKMPEGAFTWVCPSAEESVKAVMGYWADRNVRSEILGEGFDSESMFLTYPVPIKSGSHLQTAVLNPLAGESAQLVAEIVARTMSSFTSTNIDVLVKKQNTERFLGTCQQALLSRNESRRDVKSSPGRQGRFDESAPLPNDL